MCVCVCVSGAFVGFVFYFMGGCILSESIRIYQNLSESITRYDLMNYQNLNLLHALFELPIGANIHYDTLYIDRKERS